MVQKQGFRVTLRRPGGQAFPEVQDPCTGDIYVVASPGELFEIHYEILPERRLPSGAGTTRIYCFDTFVDGKSIGIRKITWDTSVAVGFVRSGDSTSITYDLFKFAEAAADDSTLAQSLSFKEGRIKVTVEEVRKSGAELPPHLTNSKVGHAAAAVAALPEGKKFFLAPSLTTASGGTATDRRGFSTSEYVTVAHNLAQFDIRYEKPSTLLLRKILTRENPEHAAILDSFEETRYRPQPAPAEIKQERGRIKRERGVPEVVDLTGRVPPPPAERLAPGETLECDLTADSDDERAAPRWTKRRVAVEEVELEEDVASTQQRE